MDLMSVRDVIREYKTVLRGITGGDGHAAPFDEHVFDEMPALAHLGTMPAQMETFIAHHHTEKVMRWLGFMQGVLWANGVYTLNELRKHNDPDCEDK